MYKLILIILCGSILTVSPILMRAQNLTPAMLVQQQLDTYNQRDLDGFINLFASDVKLYKYNENQPIADGINEVKLLYKKLFEQSPNLHSNLLSRIVLNNKVIDHERITGRNGNSGAVELVVIYEVNNQKINRVTVIYP